MGGEYSSHKRPEEAEIGLLWLVGWVGKRGGRREGDARGESWNITTGSSSSAIA
jgi:hypothetical protein